jgi:hypothetical protein
MKAPSGKFSQNLLLTDDLPLVEGQGLGADLLRLLQMKSPIYAKIKNLK